MYRKESWIRRLSGLYGNCRVPRGTSLHFSCPCPARGTVPVRVRPGFPLLALYVREDDDGHPSPRPSPRQMPGDGLYSPSG